MRWHKTRVNLSLGVALSGIHSHFLGTALPAAQQPGWQLPCTIPFSHFFGGEKRKCLEGCDGAWRRGEKSQVFLIRCWCLHRASPGQQGFAQGFTREKERGWRRRGVGSRRASSPGSLCQHLLCLVSVLFFFFFPLFFRFWICFGAASRREKQGANIRASPGRWKTTPSCGVRARRHLPGDGDTPGAPGRGR